MKSKRKIDIELACIINRRQKAFVRSFNNCGPGFSTFLFLLLFTGCNCKNPTQVPSDKTVIKGTAADSLTGQPLPGTVVRLDTGLTSTSGSDGNYRLVGMGGGCFTLNFEKNDWRQKGLTVTVAVNDSVILDTMKLQPCQWQEVEINLPSPWFSDLEDICFVGENEGWAVGSDQGAGYPGYIIHTTDGGHTWEMQFGAQPIDAWYFHNVDFVDNQCGWAVAASDQMKRTTDGGIMWMDIIKPFYGSGYAMDFIDKNTGWIAQYYGGGGVYKTIDGGNTWVKLVELPDSGLCSIKFLDANRGWLRSSNKVYATVDGGSTWSLCLSKPYSGTGQDSEIDIILPNNVWVEGYQSIDGGLNWIKQESDTFGFISAISFYNYNYGWMAAKKDVYSFFIHTTDGGQSWEKISPPENYSYILAMQFISPHCGWATGDNKILVYK